jgi:hypothetical protein
LEDFGQLNVTWYRSLSTAEALFDVMIVQTGGTIGAGYGEMVHDQKKEVNVILHSLAEWTSLICSPINSARGTSSRTSTMLPTLISIADFWRIGKSKSAPQLINTGMSMWHVILTTLVCSFCVKAAFNGRVSPA